MATEYKFPYSASEINEKLKTVDETKNSLENDYYTSTDIDTKLETKADLVNGKVPAEQLPDDISGGLTEINWEDIKNKPFGEIGLSIEWDGAPTEYEPIDVRDILGCICYKVGEKIEKNNIVGCTITISKYFDDPIVVDSNMIIDFNDKTFAVMYNGTPVLFVASEKNTVDLSIFGLVGQTLEIPFDGLWFYLFNDGLFTKSILSPDYKIKQIDSKFIPNYFGEIGFYTDCDISNATATVSVPVNEDEFGISEFNFFKFSEPIDGSIKGYLLSVLIDEENMEISMGDENNDASLIVSDTGSEYTLYALNIKTDNEIVNMEDFRLPIFTVAEAGLYVVDISSLGGQINYFKSPDYNMIKIDKKFIPDDITAAVSLTFDEFPIEGSQNPVKSAGIHSAISALESKVTSAFCYKGTVQDYADLPIEGNSIGDVWNIANADETNEVEAGDNAAWDGESWDILAGVIDLSNYYTKEEINTLIGNCDTVINSINTLIGGV